MRIVNVWIVIGIILLAGLAACNQASNKKVSLEDQIEQGMASADDAFDSGNFEEAERLYGQTLSKIQEKKEWDDPRAGEIHYKLARIDMSQDDLDAAEKGLEEALKIKTKNLGPDHLEIADILDAQGELYLKREKYDEAENKLKTSLEIKENNLGKDDASVAVTLDVMGRLYRRMDKQEEAKNALVRSLEIKHNTLGPRHPQLAVTLNDIGNVYFSMEKYLNAQKYYAAAVQVNPDYYKAHHNLGNVNYTLGYQTMKEGVSRRRRPQQAREAKDYFQAARESFQAAIQKKPTYESHHDLGSTLYQLSKLENNSEEKAALLDEAIEEYKKAIALQPDNAKGHVDLAGAYMSSRLTEEALGEFDKALELSPDDSSIFYSKGEALEGQGKYQEAKDAYEKCVELKEDNLSCKNSLRRVNKKL